METTLWVCGQVKSWPVDGGIEWEWQGVYDTQEKAVAACRTELYFIAPVHLNEERPHENTGVWQGAYYPLAPKPAVVDNE